MISNGAFPSSLPSRRSVTPGGLASLVLVVAATVVLLFLLWRTESNAVAIRGEAASIAANGRGINDYTDSILQLNNTNQLATSILASAKPLNGSLTAINTLATNIDKSVAGIQTSATSIDASGKSINTSATAIVGDVTAINQTASTIASTAGGVNANAATILNTASSIERGIALINSNASAVSGIVNSILADARGIDSGAGRTNHLACSIDNGLNGGARC